MNAAGKVIFCVLYGLLAVGGVTGWVYLTHDSARQVREAREAEYQEGYEAGAAGVPVEACPYFRSWSWSNWRKGWIDGQVKVNTKETNK